MLESKVEEQDQKLKEQEQQVIDEDEDEEEILVDPEMFFGEISGMGDIEIKFTKKMLPWD